jgi:hypothetical protein
LQNKIAATTPTARRPTATPVATATPKETVVATATATSPPPPSPSPSPTPVPTNSPTPTTASDQTLWKDGVAGPDWWNQPLTVAADNAVAGSIASVAGPDPVTGDGTVLQYSATGSAATGGILFSIPIPVNGYDYLDNGHLQFDMMLGPAWSSANTIDTFFRDDPGFVFPWGQTNQMTQVTGLSTTAFVHVSLPLTWTAGYPYANALGIGLMPAGQLYIGVFTPGTIPAGVQFYVDNVQLTAN